jgi:predicted DNA-binding ribbon-helix-helix protein
MSTTPLRAIRVSDQLWKQMKKLAKAQETSVTQLLIRLMNEELAK